MVVLSAVVAVAVELFSESEQPCEGDVFQSGAGLVSAWRSRKPCDINEILKEQDILQ